MSEFDISNAVAITLLNTFADLLDGGTGPGYFDVYTGAKPATLGDAETGTKLSRMIFQATAFGSATDGGGKATVDLSSAMVTDDDAEATGTPGYFRAYDGDDTPLFQGTCGVAGSGAMMIVTKSTITLNDDVDCDSFILDFAEAQ